MLEAINLSITFLSDILLIIPDSPFMFLFGLAIVLIITRNVFIWIK